MATGLDAIEAMLQEKFGDNLLGNRGRWQATVPETEWRFFCMTDIRADRMRFMIPVAQAKGDFASHNFANLLLEANFHSALDARYCLHDGSVWAAFIHPLTPLTAEQARAAIEQVIQLAQTTGTTFSSTNIRYVGGGGAGSEESAEAMTVAVADRWRETQLRDQCEELTRQNRDMRRMIVSLTRDLEVARPQRRGDDDSGEGGGSGLPEGGGAEGIPDAFICPVTLELMRDPVSTADGHTYEREAIERWLQDHLVSPKTNEPLPHTDLVPNFALRSSIETWQELRH